MFPRSIFSKKFQKGVRIVSGIKNIKGLGRTLSGGVKPLSSLAQFASFKMRGQSDAVGFDIAGLRSTRSSSSSLSLRQSSAGLLGYLRRGLR